MLPQSHAYFGASQDATAMQASVHAPGIASPTAAAGSAKNIREVEAEAASVAPVEAPVRASPPFAKYSLQETPTATAGVVASKALKPTDGIKDIPQGVNTKISSADTESSMDSSGQYCLGLKQLALQSVLLLVSWGFLALLQPNGRPLLLLVAIALSRLHLGWLLCCVLRMLLPRWSSKEPSECLKEPNQGRLSAFFWRLRRRCWSRLPLRYWHSAFYLFLLLAAFWAASVVWEDSQDGLQALQSGGGTPFPSTQAWMGGGFPSLLLNSDSPQHVKIAATAVARGREASDRLIWLVHSTSQQQFGRVLLWLRSLTFWLNSVLLQPFAALLRHTGLLASVNGTCSLSDAPEAASDSGGPEEGWLLWIQAAIQSAVRSLPNAAHTFLCGDKASGDLSVEEEAAAWSKRAPEAPLDFGAEGSVVEIGPYCLALLLLLAYSLSTALHRVGLAGFAAFRHLLSAWGMDQGGSSKKPWAENLAVACRSALTAFAAAFVLLALLWGAAAVTARAVVLMRSVWRCLFGTEAADPARTRQQKATDSSTSGQSIETDAGGRRGAAGLEILAACLTCWVLLLSDREFVMFTWATMQPLRLSVLSTVLLLRLPSSQVATLLTWPPPLREPALVLQRSQPLRIIDPVAVGSMLGCVLAAAALRLVLHLAAKLGSLFRSHIASSCTTQADGDLRLLGVSRGQWGVRSSPLPSGGDSPAPNTLWQKLQEQNHLIAELQASLKKERSRATLAEELIAKLKEEARAQTVKAPPEGLTDSNKQILPSKPQVESPRMLAVGGGIGSGQPQQRQPPEQPQHHEQEMQPKQQQNEEHQQQQEGGDLAKDTQQQVLGTPQQQTNVYAEELQDAQKQLEDLQRQLCEAQSQLSELQQKRDSETLAYERLQQHLEAEAEQWRTRDGEARAECDRLKADLAEASRSLEGLRHAQGEQQQQAVATQAEDKAQIKRMEQLLQKQAEDLASKTAQINELREKLAQMASANTREAVRLVDSHSQTPSVQGEGLLEQAGGPTPNEFAEQLLLKVSDLTHRIKQNVENDTKTVNLHKTILSSLVSRASPKLSHASNTGASGSTSRDIEPQPNHSSRDTALSGDDPPLLEEPNSVDPSPRKSSAAFRRPDRKEALLKEESRKLEKALQTISKCIFPLSTVLEHLELPRGTLDDARRLLGTTSYYTGDRARLQETLSRPSNCTWKGDVKALADVLAELGQAWPSEESCRRLLQREGDVHTLSPVEQKFLPLAALPLGRQRVEMVHFVLGLNTQWQSACCRLDRLEAALWLLRRSPVLRTLCATCAALHEEMSRAFTFEGFGETADTEAEKKETKGATAMTASTRWCTRIWETSENRDAALEMFDVWKDNGDFNFACLKNANNIHPPSLKGLSLLHLILSRAQAAAGQGEGKAAHTGGEGDGEGAFLQRLKTEVYGSISAPPSSSLSDTKNSAVSPASCPLTAPAQTHRCDCAICLDADLAPHGPPRDWRRQLLTMKEKQIFRIPSRKTFSPSTDTPPSQSPTPATAAKEQVLVHLMPYGPRLQPASTGPEQVVVAAAERKPRACAYPRASVASYLYHYRYSVYVKSLLRNRLTRSGVRGAENSQDTRSASDGLETAIAIVTLYCDDLTGRQNKLAEMGRHLQQEFSVANRFCSGFQGGSLLGSASVVSQATSRGSSGSPGSAGGGSVSIRKPSAPPAAEAASAPGHVPTETERGLELACQILKNVHAAAPLLTDAWNDLRSVQNKEALTVMAGLLEAWPLNQGVTDRTVLSKLPLLSLQAEVTPLRSMVATASSAAVAAEAAVKAQEAARRVNASEIAAQPRRSLRHDEISRLAGLGATKHLHPEAADGSSRGSDRSIPCPTLLTCQAVSSQMNKSSRARQLSTTLPVPSKPTRRIAAGSSSSTSDSPAQGRRAFAYMRNFSGGSAVPPPKQLHGRIGRYNTQPAEAPASQVARAGGKQHGLEPAVAPALQQLAATPAQQRRASGTRGGLSSMVVERAPPQLRLEAVDAASTASAVSGGASTAHRLPLQEPAVVVALEPSVEQSDNGNRSSPSPCLLECLENHFEPAGPGDGALSGDLIESQQALQPQCLDSTASAAASTSGAQEPAAMQLVEESS